LGLQQLLLLGLAHKLIATLKPTSQNGNAAIEPATPTSCRPNVAYCLLPFVDCRLPDNQFSADNRKTSELRPRNMRQ